MDEPEIEVDEFGARWVVRLACGACGRPYQAKVPTRGRHGEEVSAEEARRQLAAHITPCIACRN